MITAMQVGWVSEGAIVEIAPYPGGNIYKLGPPPARGQRRRYGYRRFTGERIMLACENSCRVLDWNYDLLEGFVK